MEEKRYAGFWVRAVAHSLDEVLLLIAALILTYVTLYVVYLLQKATGNTQSFGESFTAGVIQIVNVVASLAISVPYYIAMTHLRGGTLGKQVMGICVIDESTGEYPSVGRSTGRFFASILSAILFGAGYLMVIFNPQKRALHDSIAGTLSIYRRKERSSSAEDVSR